ncbi:MAG: hypothetical protein ABFS21_04260 [Actinomycetota bacterium]
MAKLQDLPALILEFRDLAKEYLLQETVGQAKKLGRFTGFSLGAAALWAIGALLIAIAAMRAIVDVLPESPYWEALGYLIAAVVVALVVLAVVKAGPSPEPESANGETGEPK